MMKRFIFLAATAALIACDSGSDTNLIAPPPAPSLDQQVRQSMSPWGVVPILGLRAPDAALVDLGQALFFDKVLSGNRDVSCATCHSPLMSSGDGLSLAIGTGAVAGPTRTLGKGKQFTPRNAPSLFNAALGAQYVFWDGRVSVDFGVQGQLRAPAGVLLPAGLSNVLAALAMIPVTNRVEMRGDVGDKDVFGNTNELAQVSDEENQAIWRSVMQRVLGIPGYVQKFAAAYPSVSSSTLGFQHAANAIAAFEASAFTKTNTAFDRYLARDDNALTTEAKRGAILFFGRARCASCHNGPMLGAQQLANAGVPQIGPGAGKQLPLDDGRQNDAGVGPPNVPPFSFRVAPLRNVELSAPYMHDGVYATLEEVVRHYNNVDSALKAFDPSVLSPALRATYHGDARTISLVSSTIDGRLRQPIGLTVAEQGQIVAFLKSLTDPAAKDLSRVIPASVPSGLPVRAP
jgi:cytochrome c peroxidase